MKLGELAELVEGIHRPTLEAGTIKLFRGEITLLGTFRKFRKHCECTFAEFKQAASLAAHKKEHAN